jgi:hypothetical protein
MGIFLAPTQPVLVAIGTENRVCYPGNTADRQPKWALRYCYFSQSTANQNEKLIHCDCWSSDLQPSARKHASVAVGPSSMVETAIIPSLTGSQKLPLHEHVSMSWWKERFLSHLELLITIILVSTTANHWWSTLFKFIKHVYVHVLQFG